MNPPTSYAQVMDYIARHEAGFGFKPAAIRLTKDELDAFLELLQVRGSIHPRARDCYDDIQVCGVTVLAR